LKVSIVLPLYNKAPYVRRALDSIAAQTFSDFEVIVVDDGSTDDGASVVKNYLRLGIQLISQPNAGPGPARNTGIRQARGDLIAFLDADDEWLPTYLEESVNSLERFGPDVAAISSGYIEFPSGLSTENMWRRRGLKDGMFRVGPKTEAALVVSMLAYMTPPTTVTRAESFRRWKGFYESKSLFGEDAFFWLKLLLNETVACNLTPLVRIHREASGLSQNLGEARPVEPFLIDPSEIQAACPSHLQELLARILAIRAAKTACMLGYWGHWQEAKSLRQRYTGVKNWRLPYFVPAVVCSTPVGAFLGKTWRGMNALLGQNRRQA
jgi:glycosyltransferase involved in cell wall biosynthesis